MATTMPDLRPMTGASADWDPLIERAAAARFVLLGEATHGSDEFHRRRADITRRLIAEAGVTAVAVEADWPHALRVDRYVRGIGDDRSAAQALADFTRFPAWLWRNVAVAEFVAWLRAWNDALPAGAAKTGFYGLDLYSARTSIEAVVAHLDRVDPQAASRARERYACFDRFGRDPQIYAREAGTYGAESCEDEVVDQLVELRERAAAGGGDDDFHASQNALLVANAELYYRALVRGGAESWNLRDAHMVQTLEALADHLGRTSGHPAKVAVWAHNSHVGDERATQDWRDGHLSAGQLARERHGDGALLVGLTTYAGTVTAASEWGGRATRMDVRRAFPASWEAHFHEQGVPAFLVEARHLRGARLERAIGAIYRPELERVAHCFESRMAERFDWVVHLDETTAVQPLD
jgi:erythromycin esterase-like protein